MATHGMEKGEGGEVRFSPDRTGQASQARQGFQAHAPRLLRQPLPLRTQMGLFLFGCTTKGR